MNDLWMVGFVVELFKLKRGLAWRTQYPVALVIAVTRTWEWSWRVQYRCERLYEICKRNLRELKGGPTSLVKEYCDEIGVYVDPRGNP
jgi:hypothetical protein